ncbi:MAG: biotin/lipoyl-binding protein, partial [Chloroflexaceae bacterium]|nr:biotin/lipoyl-binding protein [Chloroflexaceae bacterium]
MRNILIAIALLAVLGGGFYFFFLRGGNTSEPEQAQEGPTIDDLDPVQAVDRVVAEAEVVPISSVELRFELSGTVADILVDEGSQVQRDDSLVVLDTRELELRVEEAKAQLKQAQAEYDAL